MHKKLFLGTIAILASLSACSNPSSSSSDSSSSDSSITDPSLKIASPAGAPAISLYTHINDESFVTNKDATQVALAVKQSTNVDAIVFDGVNALKFVKGGQTQTKWKLARWLTGGNFFIVSTKHTKEETFDTNSKICSFGNGLLPDKVFRELTNKKWEWDIADENINYQTGTAQVSAILASDAYASYDYYFIAEPSLQAAKATLKTSHPEVTINEIYNLRTEWAAYSKMDYIPQAGLFVNPDSYENKRSSFDVLLKEIDQNLTDAVDNPSEIVKKLNELEPSEEKQTEKLGFKAALIGALQKDGANRFGIVKPGTITDNRSFVNDFMSKVGESVSFSAEQFLG